MIDSESKEKWFSFLDIKKSEGRYKFDIYCKPTARNAQIKPYFCITTSAIMSV